MLNTVVNTLYGDFDIFKIAIIEKFENIFQTSGLNTWDFSFGNFYTKKRAIWNYNVTNIVEKKNAKYTGWEITMKCGKCIKLYVERWVMTTMVNDSYHAKNILKQNLKIV